MLAQQDASCLDLDWRRSRQGCLRARPGQVSCTARDVTMTSKEAEQEGEGGGIHVLVRDMLESFHPLEYLLADDGAVLYC